MKIVSLKRKASPSYRESFQYYENACFFRKPWFVIIGLWYSTNRTFFSSGFILGPTGTFPVLAAISTPLNFVLSESI